MFTIFTILTAATTLSTHSSTIRQCLAPPAGATKDQIVCASDACDDYQAAYAACPDQPCRDAAWQQHLNDMIACAYVMTPDMISDSDIESDPWITFWTNGSTAGISFDGQSPAGSLAIKF